MRRGFSIFLILFFGLGPLSVFADSDDASLPACCRRNGEHHCAMNARMAAEMAAMMRDAAPDGMATLSAPTTCPQYPGPATMFPAPTAALAVSILSLPVLQTQTRLAPGNYATPHSAPARTHAGRGPPQA